MADTTPPQTYENHRRYVPGFHFVTSGILLLNVLFWLYKVVFVRPFAYAFLDGLLVGIALLLLFFYTRQFAITVQDRVIRLEEQIRIQRLAPDLAPRLGELSRGQCVALRFASDAELPALARKVLDEGIKDQNAIKKQIQSWRPDHLRA
ncbi:MAG TPA: DUF6526 family protein [Thermoanaerobaculia bacterium]|nr:DUF6526 family protein [Thermoanaerobaculia bacterium]